MRFSPITGVVGHRQVGKTTLVSALSSHYVTLDSAPEHAVASVDPEGFLVRHVGDPAAIDECQLAPPLFPALKEWVRTRKKPGQFVLTGSVRFTSRKAIRESLTGRIITWELLPMDWSEQYGTRLPDSVIRILKSREFDSELPAAKQFSSLNYEKYLEIGGLPGVFGVRDAAIRAQRFETQINTILERDLKLLLETTLPYRTLRRLLASLAKRSGEPFAAAEVARETRISLPTLRKLISAFESLFLIRFVPSEGAFAKPILFFEDLGEQRHLLGGKFSAQGCLTAFLYQNLRVQFHYRSDLRGEIFSYRSRAGNRVPICFRLGDAVLGLIPLASDADLSDAHADAKHFQKQVPGAKVAIVSVEDRDERLGPGIRMLGAGRLLT